MIKKRGGVQSKGRLDEHFLIYMYQIVLICSGTSGVRWGKGINIPAFLIQRPLFHNRERPLTL